MSRRILILTLLAACPPPPAQPSYFQNAPPAPYPAAGDPQPYQPAQQPYQPAPPPPAYQPVPAAPVATGTCSQDLGCYGRCNPLTQACIASCDGQTAHPDIDRAHAVLQCMGASGCSDQNCVVQRCNTQLSTCTGQPIAAAPPPPAPAAPAAGGGSITPGRYACQALSYTVNTLPHYVPSTMGTIEIDASGTYHAPQFSGGDGTVSLSGHLLTFIGGSLAGWVVWADESESGKFIRFDSKDHQHPQPSARLGDSVCYIQK